MSEFESFSKWFGALVDTSSEVIKGKRDEVGMAFMAVTAGGHILLEDFPGTGKTTLAKTLARCIDGTTKRIQFTPDLLPSDVTGSMILNQQTSQLEFRRGPIFANIVLADEINRASPKTQSALLEVMEERTVTVDNETRRVDDPFVVIATQNPIEQEGTYRLPEAQVDRFMIKMSLGYPDYEAETQMLSAMVAGHGLADVRPMMTLDTVDQMVAIVRSVQVERTIQEYIVRLCEYTRTSMPEVRLGVSPRGAGAMLRMAQAMAAANATGYVTPDHVQLVAPYVMAHRLLLTPEAEMNSRIAPGPLVERALAEVPVH